MEPTRLHSLKEVEKLLGLSPSTVRRRILDGTIRTTRIGGRILVSSSELIRVMTPDASSIVKEEARG